MRPSMNSLLFLRGIIPYLFFIASFCFISYLLLVLSVLFGFIYGYFKGNDGLKVDKCRRIEIGYNQKFLEATLRK